MSTIELPTGLVSPLYMSDDRGGLLIVLSSVFIGVEVIGFGFRIWARHLTASEVGWDDILLVPALLCSLAVCACSIVAVPYGGVGRHTLTVIEDDYTKLMFLGKYTLVITPILYIVAANLSKLAILNLYVRVFLNRTVLAITHVLGLVLILQTIATILVTVLQCRPLNLLWTTVPPQPSCIDTHAFFTYATLPNIVTDVFMLVIPWSTIWKLQTTTHVKVGLTFTFLTGSIGLVASILRFVAFFSTNIRVDPCWSSVNLFGFTIAETGTYFLAACFPAYRPLFIYFKNKSFFSRRTSYITSFRSSSTTSHRKQGNLSIEHGYTGRITPGSSKRSTPVRNFESVVLSNLDLSGLSDAQMLEKGFV